MVDLLFEKVATILKYIAFSLFVLACLAGLGLGIDYFIKAGKAEDESVILFCYAFGFIFGLPIGGYFVGLLLYAIGEGLDNQYKTHRILETIIKNQKVTNTNDNIKCESKETEDNVEHEIIKEDNVEHEVMKEENSEQEAIKEENRTEEEKETTCEENVGEPASLNTTVLEKEDKVSISDQNEFVVVPDGTGHITCPKCKTVQRDNRTKCFSCGAKLIVKKD